MSSLTDALKALIEYDVVDKGTAAYGVVQKVIADDGVQDLSVKQAAVYANYIEKYLEQKCERDECLGGGSIELEDLPEAYSQRFELGGLYCEMCIYAEHRIDKLVAEDD